MPRNFAFPSPQSSLASTHSWIAPKTLLSRYSTLAPFFFLPRLLRCSSSRLLFPPTIKHSLRAALPPATCIAAPLAISSPPFAINPLQPRSAPGSILRTCSSSFPSPATLQQLIPCSSPLIPLPHDPVNPIFFPVPISCSRSQHLPCCLPLFAPSRQLPATARETPAAMHNSLPFSFIPTPSTYCELQLPDTTVLLPVTSSAFAAGEPKPPTTSKQ